MLTCKLFHVFFLFQVPLDVAYEFVLLLHDALVVHPVIVSLLAHLHVRLLRFPARSRGEIHNFVSDLVLERILKHIAFVTVIPACTNSFVSFPARRDFFEIHSLVVFSVP